MTTSELLQIARQQINSAIADLKRRAAIEKKADTELRVEAELFVDDAIAAGLDPNNPMDLAVIGRAWAMRHADDDDGTA